MDNQGAIKYFVSRKVNGERILSNQCRNAEDLAIKALQHCHEWISVKDRLPEKQTIVLVYVPPYSDEDEEYIGHVAMSYYTHSARGGYWAGTDGNTYGAIGIIHEPTHWMPLPEPPKGEV